MLGRHWKATTVAAVLGIVALLGPWAAARGQEEPVKARGILYEMYETDEGEEVLVLRTEDSTLTLYLESTTKVWYGEAEASTELLWEEFDREIEVEVEYVVIEDRNVLEKVWVLTDLED